jgi:mannose-6-phosphate isomerase-like protein (cupin superfamily)
VSELVNETEVGSKARHKVLSLRDRLNGAQPDGETSRGSVTDEELGGVFGAPWRSIELVRQTAGTQSPLRRLTNSDLLMFVVAGEGTAQFPSGPLELKPGTSIAILKGEEYFISVGGDAQLEFFCAEMALPE